MRIARILTRPNVGGPTRQAAALYGAHRRLGCRTLLLVGRCPPGEASWSPSQLAVPHLSLAQALDRGRDAEGLVEVPELGPGFHPLRDLRAGRQLRALLAAFAPDVVHTHTSKAGVLGRRAARSAGVPRTAHTFHGHVLRDYFGGLRSRLLTALERHLASRTSLLFAVSPSCADELAELGVAPRHRIAVTPPAIPLVPTPDGARTAARRRLGIPDDAWVAVCAGRLVPIKRTALFLAAVEAVEGLRGHVYGDGPLGTALLRRCGPRVELRGNTPDLLALLPAYDVLVIPSAREGCPLVALEAFATGLPVVGFDVPGVRDALGPWGGGLLVPAAEGAPGLGRALQRLRDEPLLSAACISAGRAGLSRFAPDTVAATLFEHYRRGDGQGAFA